MASPPEDWSPSRARSNFLRPAWLRPEDAAGPTVPPEPQLRLRQTHAQSAKTLPARRALTASLPTRRATREQPREVATPHVGPYATTDADATPHTRAALLQQAASALSVIKAGGGSGASRAVDALAGCGVQFAATHRHGEVTVMLADALRALRDASEDRQRKLAADYNRAASLLVRSACLGRSHHGRASSQETERSTHAAALEASKRGAAMALEAERAKGAAEREALK
jgi:hypothetical protein